MSLQQRTDHVNWVWPCILCVCVCKHGCYRHAACFCVCHAGVWVLVHTVPTACACACTACRDMGGSTGALYNLNIVVLAITKLSLFYWHNQLSLTSLNSMKLRSRNKKFCVGALGNLFHNIMKERRLVEPYTILSMRPHVLWRTLTVELLYLALLNLMQVPPLIFHPSLTIELPLWLRS